MQERTVRFPVLLANIQALMKAKGIDQAELAHLVDSSQPSVSRWGYQSVPRGQTLSKLAGLAGVDPTAFIDTPLDEARRAHRASLPSGNKLSEMMAAMLDSVGLSHLADEYAPKLARLLPTILEGGQAQLDDQSSDKAKPRDVRTPVRAKGDRDKRP